MSAEHIAIEEHVVDYRFLGSLGISASCWLVEVLIKGRVVGTRVESCRVTLDCKFKKSRLGEKGTYYCRKEGHLVVVAGEGNFGGACVIVLGV